MKKISLDKLNCATAMNSVLLVVIGVVLCFSGKAIGLKILFFNGVASFVIILLTLNIIFPHKNISAQNGDANGKKVHTIALGLYLGSLFGSVIVFMRELTISL